MPSFPLKITSGLPTKLDLLVTLPTGRAYWLDQSQFEIKMQIRDAPRLDGNLILDCTQYLTVAMVDVDHISVSLDLTSTDSAALCSGGYYDIIISDKSSAINRANVLLQGPVRQNFVVTEP